MKYPSCFVALLLMSVTGTVVAQSGEFVVPLSHNFTLTQAKPQLQGEFRAPDSLPFRDDFAYPGPFADGALWLPSNTFINATYPIQPPTVGVATFDGIDGAGKPYSNGANSFGPADTLTSIPIKLGSNQVSDSVYLSFYFQAQGIGNIPNSDDSLILQFKGSNDGWHTVWRTTVANAPLTDFDSVYVLLDQVQYFNDTFQFRFYNYATLSGNVDHWHLDYVLLDEGRSKLNPFLNDVAYLHPGPSLLDPLTAAPLRHVKGFEATMLRDSLRMQLKNHFGSTQNVTPRYRATENCGSTTIFDDFYGGTIGAFPSLSVEDHADELFATELTTLLAGTACEELTVTTRYYIEDSVDIVTVNDRVDHHQVFGDYMAYDDGSAEVGYGLHGLGAQFAYAYTANVPDTIGAVRIHFARINKDNSNLLFSIRVWKSLDFAGQGAADDILYQQDFLSPSYIDSINGFATYVLDTPVLISGDFYVGWLQSQAQNLTVGADRNHDASDHAYFQTAVSGGWQQSQQKLAVMLRPVFGTVMVSSMSTPVAAAQRLEISPNPATSRIQIHTRFAPQSRLTIMDIRGMTWYAGHGDQAVVDIAHLPAGLYLVTVKSGSSVSTGRFIKP